MAAKLAKALRAHFEARLAACFPNVRSEKAKLASPASRCYAVTVGPGVTWFVQLVILDDRDDFAVEIAWSRTGQYPEKRAKAEPRGVAPLGAEAFVDLAALWLGAPPPAKSDEGGLWIDLWWHALPRGPREEIVRRVLPSDSGDGDVPAGRLEALVDHAMWVLVRYGIPHLRHAAESLGLRVDRAPAWEPAPQEVDPALLPKIMRLKRTVRTREESEDEVRALQERVNRLLRHPDLLPGKPRKGKRPSRPSSRSH
jgi:hypothetical protein